MTASATTAARRVVRPLDDFEPGSTFATGGRTITEADVVGFCALTGDWHPQHSDAEWSAESIFGARIVPGMQVLSYAIGLMALDPQRVVALRALRRVTFKRPAMLGDTIRAEGEITRSTPGGEGLRIVTVAVQIRAADRLSARVEFDVVIRDPEA
ncbi:MAG: dehydratase [Actinomycetota bacterium]|nr:dehydratase [Actinomycetota bacterium]